MSPLRDQLLETATAYFAAHNSRDIAKITNLCTPDCTHTTGPASLPSPSRNNDEYATFNAEVFTMLTTYNATLRAEHPPVVDEEARTVVVYVEAEATADAGLYKAQYVITMKMDAEGKLVREQYDFIDSLVMTEWVQKLGEAAKETWETNKGK